MADCQSKWPDDIRQRATSSFFEVVAKALLATFTGLCVEEAEHAKGGRNSNSSAAEFAHQSIQSTSKMGRRKERKINRK